MINLKQLTNEYLAANAAEDKFQVLPAGWWFARIANAEIKQSKNNQNNYYLNVSFNLTEKNQTYKGAYCFLMLNLEHENKQAQAIAFSQYKKLKDAIGASEISQPSDLLGYELQIKTTIQKNEQYGEQVRVVDFKPIENISGDVPF